MSRSPYLDAIIGYYNPSDVDGWGRGGAAAEHEAREAEAIQNQIAQRDWNRHQNTYNRVYAENKKINEDTKGWRAKALEDVQFNNVLKASIREAFQQGLMGDATIEEFEAAYKQIKANLDIGIKLDELEPPIES